MERYDLKTAEFAALCGVKKDTLLHYDHIDLLKPKRVGENGYRYYDPRQLAAFDFIDALRRLDTPLSEIRDYLTRRSPEALLDLLAEKKRDIAARRRRLERMEALLDAAVQSTAEAMTAQPGEIRIETLPAAALAVVKAPDFDRFEEGAYLLRVRDLLAWAREQGTAFQSPGDIIKKESLEADRFLEDYYYCPVPKGVKGWKTVTRPAGTYAVLIHRGSYRSEPEAVRRLRDWTLENGYVIDGDLYEEDLVSYATSPDREAYLMRLCLKIRKKEEN